MVKGYKTPRRSRRSSNKLNQNVPKELEKQRQIQEKLKQLEISSSSSTETKSSQSFSSLYEAGAEEEIKNILEILCASDAESIEEEEPEYVQRKSLPEESDFAQTFGRIPNVETISEDISISSIVMQKPHSPYDTSRDMGKFVNPLTGLDIRASQDLQTSSSFEEEKEAGASDDEESDKSFQALDEGKQSRLFMPQDILDLDEDIKKPAVMEDTLQTFLELETETEIAKPDEIDWEALAREEESKWVKQNTFNFLTDLINKVIEIAEHISPEKFLIQNLDKRKLVLELIALLPNYNTEKSRCTFLNRQIVQHFKRKKSYRFIMPDNPKNLMKDKEKFKEAKEHLDRMMAQEIKLKKSAAGLHEDLGAEHQQLKKQADTEIELFENQVRKNLSRDSGPKLNAVIDQLLLTMEKYRQEISEVRLSLFLQQHTEAKLTELLNKLNDLGNGLTMNDFTTLQSENQVLDKKIEERNAELKKLYKRCRNDVHTLAHYRENQRVIYSNISLQNIILENALDDKQALREHLYELKLQRTRIQSKIEKLSAQGGLLDKPNLMFDYDITAQRCWEQKELVGNLKRILLEIQRKIEKITKNCQNNQTQ